MTGINRSKRGKRNSTRLLYSKFKQIPQRIIVQFMQSLDIQCVITPHGITFGSAVDKGRAEKELLNMLNMAVEV